MPNYSSGLADRNPKISRSWLKPRSSRPLNPYESPKKIAINTWWEVPKPFKMPRDAINLWFFSEITTIFVSADLVLCLQATIVSTNHLSSPSCCSTSRGPRINSPGLGIIRVQVRRSAASGSSNKAPTPGAEAVATATNEWSLGNFWMWRGLHGWKKGS